MKRVSKALWKISLTAAMSFAIAALFGLSVYALPADTDHVYATKTGKVWHRERNCKEIIDNDAWYMTFAEYKKEKGNTTQCSKCKNDEDLAEEINGKTYAYEGGYSRSTEIPVTVDKSGLNDTSTSASSDTGTAETSGGSISEDSSSSGSTKSKSSRSTTASSSGGSSKASTKSSSGSTAKSTASSAGSSSGSSSGKDLMTERQRHNKFYSKTNPKRGKTVITPARPKSAGFSYADFGSYNDYNSNNGRGGDFIYLLGTIMSMEPVKQTGDEYSVAMMVNDCDGYQWYMRYDCSKTNYALLKAELTGKPAYIYGRFGGYSGVTERPMMDVWTVLEVGGKSLDLRLFK